MSLYYQDDYVTLHHGDCLEVLPSLDIQADVLLTDPPYFKVKQDEWDNQWDKASEFLAWMGQFLDAAKPLLTPHASVWVFASPAMTSSVERLVGERFRVLNSIRWVKEAGWHQKQEVVALRRYLTPWEGVIFAEGTEDPYEAACDALRREVFAQVGLYLVSERERAGHSRGDVARRLAGYKNAASATANIFNWELGKNLITLRDYEGMRDALGEGFLKRPYEVMWREYDHLTREYEEKRRAYAHLRRVFSVKDRKNSTDVWTFDPVAPFPGKHPCEKPESMLRHMIETSSRPSGTILDPFAGSGSTLIAASHAGRNAIGIEKDERWCEHAANRLSQGALDIFGEAS